MSRISAEYDRLTLGVGDDWKVLMSCSSEDRARDEFSWLNSHNKIRDYVLVAATDTFPEDEMPF